jgi:hypothetical protein
MTYYKFVYRLVDCGCDGDEYEFTAQGQDLADAEQDFFLAVVEHAGLERGNIDVVSVENQGNLIIENREVTQ